jgi:hypothetical protein
VPTYTLKRVSTGEEWNVHCPFDDLAQMLEDDDVVKVLTVPNFTTQPLQDNVARAGKDWQEHLGRIKKNSGRKNTINV